MVEAGGGIEEAVVADGVQARGGDVVAAVAQIGSWNAEGVVEVAGGVRARERLGLTCVWNSAVRH